MRGLPFLSWFLPSFCCSANPTKLSQHLSFAIFIQLSLFAVLLSHFFVTPTPSTRPAVLPPLALMMDDDINDDDDVGAPNEH